MGGTIMEQDEHEHNPDKVYEDTQGYEPAGFQTDENDQRHDLDKNGNIVLTAGKEGRT
jgi:hypothetical protein